MDAFGRTDRNPRGSPGPGLVFSLPGFDPGETVSVSYAARVGSTAGLGRQANRASAFAYVKSGRKRLLSPVARAEVVVEASRAFREDGTVVGKVFLDCDADGVQTPGGGLGEAGVPGVRIVFENGVSATTDALGRYSVYGFDPVTHVARIDPTTLPAGVRPRLTDNRQALDANRSLAVLFDRKFTLAPRPPPPAHTRRAVSSPPPAKRTPESRAVAVWPTVKILPATRDLAAEIQSFDNALDFVDLADGDVLGQQVVSIRVKGESSGWLALNVNGKEIGEDRVGARDLSPFEKTREGVNAGVYLKGRVRGDALLTLSYDSDRDADAPGFRDLDPDDFFPIYGDGSVRAFDAQSSDKLYVKVEKDRSYALYGDFDAAAGQDHLKLGRHGRNLTGGKAHVERGRVAANVFAAREDHLRCVIEIPALDDDGNPQFIRLTFERRGDGTRHWVRGGNARLRVSDGVVAGVGVVDSAEPEKPLRLYSAWTSSRIGEDGTLTTEFAHSGSEREGNGRAGRVQYDHQADRLEIHLSAAQTAKSFDSPDAFLGAGRTEARAEVRTRLREGFWVETEGVHAENRIDGSRRTGVKAGVERAISDGLSSRVGGRIVDERTARAANEPGNATTASAFVGFDWRPAFLPRLSLEGEYERRMGGSLAVDALDRQRLSVGGAYRFAKGRIYAKHDTGASEWDAFTPGGSRHTTVIGGEYGGIANLGSFSEYRTRTRGAEASSSELAVGVRGHWTTDRGLASKLRVERVAAIENADSSASVAASADYESPDRLWAARAKAEWSGGSDERTWYGELGIARQVSPSWSVLLRNRTAFVDDRDGESDSLENRLRTGLAWRPAGDNRANALAWYEWAHRRDKANEDGHRAKHLWSVSADYRPTARLILNGGYAGKWSSQKIRKELSVSETHLLQQLSSRLTFDLTDRFDIGLAGSALFEGAFRNPVWRLGTEAGMVLQEDAWLSAGYNVLGYDEEDLGGGQRKGFYLRLRLKLDESLLGWLQ